MSGDVPILFILIVATTVAASGLTLWERHETTHHRDALLLWALGYLMIAAGCLLRVLPAMPHEIEIGLSNILVTWGYGLIAIGVHCFAGRLIPRWATAALVLATVGWVLVGQYQGLGTRIVLTSLASGALCWLGFAALRGPVPGGERRLRAQRLAAPLLALHGSFFLARAVVTAFQMETVTFWGLTMAATMFEGILWSVAGPASLLAMVREQRENRHRKASTTDFLTGLDNRRAFFDRGEAMLRTERNVAVLVFDLDHFKRINDVHGHAVGDQMLMLFSRLAEREMRTVDTLARLGGEEFAALLPGLDLSEAEAVARRVGRSLEASTLEQPDGPAVSATVSVGIALTMPGVPTHLGALLAAADRALYRAKGEGRNRIARAAPLAA